MISKVMPSRELIIGTLPVVLAIFASVLVDGDLAFLVPVVVLPTAIVGSLSYFYNPMGRWWLHALLSGILGAIAGISLLFYVGSQI